MSQLISQVTPLILTFNEEANIGRTLQQLRWAERIVVVDSFSTDRTVEIAGAERNVEVIERKFTSHVDQWNFGLSQVQTPWVLTLDADYFLPKEFIALLKRDPSTFPFDGYFARFRYCVFGRPLRASLYPPRLVLFRINRGSYVQDGHTQLLQLTGTAGRLAVPILHDDRKPLLSWLAAQRRYTELEVAKLRGPKGNLSRIDRLRSVGWIAPFIMPAYCLVFRGLILDGPAGWYYALQRTYAEMLLSLQLLEARYTGVAQASNSEEARQASSL